MIREDAAGHEIAAGRRGATPGDVDQAAAGVRSICPVLCR